MVIPEFCRDWGENGERCLRQSNAILCGYTDSVCTHDIALTQVQQMLIHLRGVRKSKNVLTSLNYNFSSNADIFSTSSTHRRNESSMLSQSTMTKLRQFYHLLHARVSNEVRSKRFFNNDASTFNFGSTGFVSSHKNTRGNPNQKLSQRIQVDRNTFNMSIYTTNRVIFVSLFFYVFLVFYSRIFNVFIVFYVFLWKFRMTCLFTKMNVSPKYGGITVRKSIFYHLLVVLTHHHPLFSVLCTIS